MLKARLVVVILTAFAVGACTGPSRALSPTPGSAKPSPSISAGQTGTVDISPVKAKVSDVAVKGHPLFGIAVVNNITDFNRVGKTLGCYPKATSIFVSVPLGLDVGRFEAIPGIPFVTIQPWKYGGGQQQTDFELQDTINGSHDKSYHQIAKAIASYRQVTLVRIMHEMNGFWYPWGHVGNNTPGDYIKAWRHIVTIFRNEGATNALFVWSPNVVRFLDDKNIAQYWPGKDWVDFAGMVGYGKAESSADETYRETLTRIYALTSKPIIVTETGSDGPYKAQWIESFGRWLKANPRVVGFIWTDKPKGDLANGNWGMTTDRLSIAAFKKTIKTAGVVC